MPTTGVLLVSTQTLMQRIAPPSWLIGQHFDLAVGDKFDIHEQRLRLTKAGYVQTENVFEPGGICGSRVLLIFLPLVKAYLFVLICLMITLRRSNF